MINNLYKVLLWFLGIIFVVNLFFLDYILFKNPKLTVQNQTQNFEPQITPKPTIVVSSDSSCSADCLQTIKEEVNQVVASLPKTTTTKAGPTPTSSFNKIVYLPITGSGSTENSEWTDIPGTDFYFDLNDYPGAKNVQWEVSLRASVTDYVFVRLYDVTNKRAVDTSELSTNLTAFTLLRSGILTIWRGNNLYRVQAKGSLGNQAYVTSPRLKIFY